ncbi:MAG: hypothetical protein V8R10_13485 [Christensenellales bacterium]
MLTLSFCADGKAQTLRFLSISDVTLRFPAIPMQICGFEIRDHRADGWDADQRYEISDFEDGALHKTSSAAKSRPKTANRCRDAGKMENRTPCRGEKFRQGDFFCKKVSKTRVQGKAAKPGSNRHSFLARNFYGGGESRGG